LNITVPTAVVLQTHKWSQIFGLENLLSMHTQWPFPFITQPVNNTELRVVFWVGGKYHSTYFQVVYVAAFCITKSIYFYPIAMGPSFDKKRKNIRPRNGYIASPIVSSFVV
jgi:hypothetical protein